MPGTNPFLRADPAAPAGTREDAAAARARADGNLASLVNPFHPTALTPLRAHYLKETLLQLQVRDELALVQRPDALALLGPPFRIAPDTPRAELPLLRYVFRRFVLSFPLLQQAPADFFPGKVQVVVERFLARNITLTESPRDADTGVHRAMSRAEGQLVIMLSSAIVLRGVEEDVVRISERDRERLFQLDAQREAAHAAPRSDGEAFEVNVVAVRSVTVPGHLRNRTHDEFIFETRRGDTHVYVARRYGQVTRLFQTLRVQFPEENIPRPPEKDRRAATSSEAPTQDAAPLARENNRHTLRAYLRTLLAIRAVADSDSMQDFLLSDPITLSATEQEDVAARRREDAVREREQRAFDDETARRATELREHLSAFKEELAQPDGLSRIMATIRQCPTVAQLPPGYRVLVGWAEISLASALFHALLGSDEAPRTFAQLKHMHGMMPYFVVRQILRISNPAAMIRAMLDLFLAQPFGQRSLLQRMFAGRLQEEVNELAALAERVLDKIGDPRLGEKVDAFVAAPAETQQALVQQASTERIDLMTAILRAPIGPQLDRYQVHRAVRASRAYEQLRRARRRANAAGQREPEPEDEGAWLYEDLHVYRTLRMQIRDHEQLIELVCDATTTELLKDVVTIFYTPLANVYKLANVAESLVGVQAFVNDIIRTVEEAERRGRQDTRRTVQAFVDLVQRHEQLFYSFVFQVHTKGADLFGGLIRWLERLINFVRVPSASHSEADARRYGLGAVDLESCLPAGTAERERLMAEVDAVVHDTYRRKLLREIKVRRRLTKQTVKEAGASPAETRSADDAFVGAVADQLGFEGLVTGQAADLDVAESESDDTSDDDTLSSSDDEEGPESADHFRHHAPAARPKREKREPLRLTEIERLRPLFLELLRPALEAGARRTGPDPNA